ncbi:MAG TPA: GNAT family N-acetyltransferase [Vicinamibacterales bacterium]|jgi:CelD/BcsL family acetyltransferase involved in cellulose biosynthesis
MKVTVHPAAAWPKIAPIWDALVRAAPDASFFMSVHWTGTWLEVFGEQLQPQILVFESGGEVLGACLLVARSERRGPLTWRRVHFNTAGEDEADSACIELNGLLCRAGAEREVVAALWAHLESEDWDEFVIEAAAESSTLQCFEDSGARTTKDRYEFVRRSRANHYVCLRDIDKPEIGYERHLSRNTREQVRRSLKLYEQSGEIAVESAASAARALEMMSELADLHQRVWTARGRPGVFASARFRTFHSTLIQRAFPAGHIQVLRVATATQTIGLLYNFVWRGKVSFYQSGLHYSDDNRFKPGLIAHVLAIQQACASGCGEYDFLAGESRYKASLANAERTMVWATWQRPGPKLQLRTLLRRLKSGTRLLR